jgi:hypothetical protein
MNSAVRFAYDDFGNEVERVFLDDMHRIAVNENPIAVARSTYDERGYRTAEHYFDVDLNPVATDRGVGSIHWHYDMRGNVTEECFRALNGSLTNGPDGTLRLNGLGARWEQHVMD